MSANYTPEKEDLKILTPFKMQVLTNFPYIEADFDALTNYQLLCKIVEYLNNVIAETNEVTEQTESLYNAYVALQNYVNTYFDNLDVQEEINTKLDEMVDDGTFNNIVDPLLSDYKAQLQDDYDEFTRDTNTTITNFQGTVNTKLLMQDNKIDALDMGGPIVVTDVSDMLDTTKIYLLTTDGYWYYYNGSAWTQGGVYQDSSIDNDLANTQLGIYHSDLTDYTKLNSYGFASDIANVVSYFTNDGNDNTSPFYPLPKGKFYPAASISGAYRFTMFPIPTEIEVNSSIGFWVYNNVSASNNIQFGFLNNTESIVSNFSGITNLAVGGTQTKDGNTYIIDKKIGDWYHITINYLSGDYEYITIGQSFNSDPTTNFMYMSMPVMINMVNQRWYIKYKNKYYPGDLQNPLLNKVIGWRGDSIMNGANDEDSLNGWIGRIANNYGCTYENKAVNGARMTDTGQPGYHSIEASCTNFSGNSFDIICFDGGANDFFARLPVGTITNGFTDNFNVATFLGALEKCIYKLITTYPSAKICYIIPYKLETYQDIENAREYFDNAILVCKKWGVPYLDLREKSTMNYNVDTQYYYDEVHANASGYDFTLAEVANFLLSVLNK